jgi:hypothetical protein
MTIRIAAPRGCRREMFDVAARLARAGHQVTSWWIEGSREGGRKQAVALDGICDLGRVSCLVSFTEDPERSAAAPASGGRHVELGIAIASGKRVCIVGPRENAFHHLPHVEVYATVDDLIDGLGRGGAVVAHLWRPSGTSSVTARS